MSRWELLYPLLMDPYLFRYIKNIKLKLPSSRDDIQRRYDSMRGFSMTGFIGNRKPPRCDVIMSVVPGLVHCLQKFGSLVEHEVTITVEVTKPPDFEPLLPLYDICGKRTTVLFVDPTGHFGLNFRNSWWQWVESWDIAWKDGLIRNERKRDGNFN
ncbi:hypothetical protein D0Z07_0633 [Hyphodiscus hymeniophilus]|uniref:Uncharacterized protein n=1 Tax=Hyphodiscus hymeniophilus TaxID=353542 RepID=A0A9P6VQV3_9HELO|nr:hypothetical protein D0Z07_0633 [Hyphodiscus hymeniophilus]